MQTSEGYVGLPDGTRVFAKTIGHGSHAVVVPNGLYYVDALAPTAPEQTWVAFDPRHRGLTESSADATPAEAGVAQDLADLEALRATLGFTSMSLVGHSYVATVAALYAMRHPARVSRLVMIAPTPPDPTREYPPGASSSDGVVTQVMSRLASLRQQPVADPVVACRAFWDAIRRLYVYREEHAASIAWGRCELPQERAFLRYWSEIVEPSLRRCVPSRDALAAVRCPTLVIHGTHDRSAPFGGSEDWVGCLPSARLLRVDECAHAPWVERPDVVMPALREFLSAP